MDIKTHMTATNFAMTLAQKCLLIYQPMDQAKASVVFNVREKFTRPVGTAEAGLRNNVRAMMWLYQSGTR